MRILIPLACACFLTGCSVSGDRTVSGPGSSGSSGPSAQAASGPSAFSTDAPSGSVVDAPSPSGTLPASGTDGEPDRVCLSRYSHLWTGYYQGQLGNNVTVTESCDQIMIKDADGKPVLQIKISADGCKLTIDFHADEVNDTTFNFCNSPE